MDNIQFNCPVEATLSIIAGKYKAIILYHLFVDGVLRFNEIQKLIPNASIKMLSQQLRDLEESGIIHREIYPVIPPKTEYSLTKFGYTLKPIIMEMCTWGKTNFSKQIKIK